MKFTRKTWGYPTESPDDSKAGRRHFGEILSFDLHWASQNLAGPEPQTDVDLADNWIQGTQVPAGIALGLDESTDTNS
ncbi:hypothetical protein N7539_004897 [Penicillium diatomitis]|uniref:Uncharacterized protein n=1 Tax=Penicillium diatomitis TaxID=2819901 RepID=A0A9W9X685_9EURO|nr:uncharacterized protein N7539_004897 [Penicillium diatomitis]KAJ5484909.1 hypothetical protein N7539_004897 [Penicillium diatomitis]